MVLQSESRQSRVLAQFATTAAVCVVLLGAMHFRAVHTEAGQRQDNVAFEGRNTEPAGVREAADEVLELVTKASLAVLGAAVFLLALSQGRWRAGLGALAVIGATVVSAELLKRLIERPPLLELEQIGSNSWPSGHVSIAMSVGLALVMVAPGNRRSVAAVIAAVFAAGFGVAVVLSGWHRPSDALGACLLALMWACLVSGALVLWRGTGSSHSQVGAVAGKTFFVWGAGLLLVGYVAYFIRVMVDRGHEIGAVEQHAALLVGLVLIAGLAILVVSVFLWLLRDVELDPPVVSDSENKSTLPA